MNTALETVPEGATNGHPEDGVIRLDIGCGEKAMPGFIGIDRTMGGEAYPLAFNDGSPVPDGYADEIVASHILEHFGLDDTDKVIQEWVRALKPGGVLKIAVPDVEWCAKQILKPDHPHAGLVVNFLFGGQQNADDYHKTAFNRSGLMGSMRRAGLFCFSDWKTDQDICALWPCSLNLQAIKPSEAIKSNAFQRKVYGVLTRPRLMFSDSADCFIRSCMQVRMDWRTTGGAYYDKGVEVATADGIEKGADYILYFDYDSIFPPETLEHLLVLAEMHPEADAIAPVQVKREEDTILAYAPDADGPNWWSGDIAPAKSAHFGLTLVRTAAIKKMGRPWFRHVPDPETGGWSKNMVDADIQFWRDFTAAGGKLFIAPHIPIGHTQLMVTWPGKRGPIHQYMNDWKEKGMPDGVLR